MIRTKPQLLNVQKHLIQSFQTEFKNRYEFLSEPEKDITKLDTYHKKYCQTL